jgi:pyrrolidone-carboxylate peptidase
MKKTIIVLVISILFIFSTATSVTSYTLKKAHVESQTSTEISDSSLPIIMLTGYWNPTGQMIASFSNDSFLNPNGWKGANWEGRGYDIYSFFPNPGIYNGTFEVDYQRTWEDFWNITDQLNPIAIISFGAGAGPWEIEFNARNLNSWWNDYEPPYQPTPNPPDNTVPIGYVRHSTLPCQEIEDAVNLQTSINAWVDWNEDPGAFLCEYIAYLGMWYQTIHKDDNVNPCKAAGFIHVSSGIALIDAMNATNVTIRETIEYLSCADNPPEKPTIRGPTVGKIGNIYDYTFSADDPENDEIFYYITWGDTQQEKWIGPYESGEKVIISHLWDKSGIYRIRVFAMDICGAISEPETIEVIMLKDKTVTHPIFLILEKFPLIEKLLILILY